MLYRGIQSRSLPKPVGNLTMAQ
uniref:Uncharacterized protein n=1 Tax=Moniliophthora roreri TaxID=221103 RepID=A0A0W0ETY0_MONRR